MINLLTETTEELHSHNKAWEDVVWVGCQEFEVSLSEFLTLADTLYDDGYGGQEIATDLIICGEDFWMERHEYDGAEWWEFKTMPKRPKEIRHIERVYSHYRSWCTLAELNEEVEDDEQ